ncbi:branched-chain amino acid ABC transporter permease [Aromatoleum toluclasticum]|uniref:branched-chain amino acid ABC transporter permease n=1 Tax=Aromatoleum toluclasticum TaxID=92003 RepID=UPI001D189916|nr:branched-chain amino acid ABC transporter permease [Aromatoleum toluclasticum]MCC4113848.1 branched-chain amino acid ABC transporter permease [Aromatoleum toluclasticum]
MSALSLIQVLVSGIATGCVYGLVALSFVLIYKATGAVSFMQGELLMLGAFTVLALHEAAGLPLAAAVVLGVAAMAAFGALLERTLLRRTLGPAHLTALLLTFGLGMVMRGAVGAVPAASHAMHRLPLPFAGDSVQLGGAALAVESLAVIVATAALAAVLTLFFRRTRAGLALRACSENAEVAALMGVSVPAMHTLAWALGAGLAAIAGVLLAPVTFVHPNMGLVALKAFPAAVLGGMTSLPGALAGGVFLGVVEALAGLALPEGAKDVVPYVLMMAVLLLFPGGFAAGLRGRP